MSYTYEFDFSKMRIDDFTAILRMIDRKPDPDIVGVLDVMDRLCKQNLRDAPVTEIPAIFEAYSHQFGAFWAVQSLIGSILNGYPVDLFDEEDDEREI